jgi:hypothetical protein
LIPKGVDAIVQQLRYEITPADHLEMVKVVRSSAARQLVRFSTSLIGLLSGAVIYSYFDRPFGQFVILVFVLLIILQMFLPYIIHRRVYYRNPRLFGIRTVTFDEEGVKSDSEIGHVEKKWSSFEKFKETKNLFLIYQTKDVVSTVPKRAFATQDDATQFRNLLASKMRRA